MQFAILHKNIQWKTWGLEIWCKIPNRCHWAQVQLHGVNFGSWVFLDNGFLNLPTSCYISNRHYYMYSAQCKNTSSFTANATWSTCVNAEDLIMRKSKLHKNWNFNFHQTPKATKTLRIMLIVYTLIYLFDQWIYNLDNQQSKTLYNT